MLVTYLMGAVYVDVKTDRVPNQYILLGYLTGIYWNFQNYGIKGIITFLVNALWPIVLLYILFCIRAVGAGDIKLISVMSTYLVPSTTIHVVVASVFVGAFLSILKILSRRRQRSERVFVYSTAYRSRSLIHYTICILVAFIYVCVKEGLYG